MQFLSLIRAYSSAIIIIGGTISGIAGMATFVGLGVAGRL